VAMKKATVIRILRHAAQGFDDPPRQIYGVKTSFTEENVAPGFGPPEMT
jgi:hypothetical protein